MSSSDRAVSSPTLRRGLALFAALGIALSGCTVAPLYARPDATSLRPGQTALADVRGRIAVSAAATRTSQVYRNSLLFRLNGGTQPVTPLYEVRGSATGSESVVSIQRGSGIPTASLYVMRARFEVVRLRDSKVIAKGTRSATAGFDRSVQLYASTRSIIEARDRAGATLSEQVELAVIRAIRTDLGQ